MQSWLVKTEPGEYAFADLLAAGSDGDDWDGVRNHQAAGFLRRMRVGDRVFVYHSGRERAIVGTAEVIRAAYPDPTDASGRFVAVRLRARNVLPQPVTLAAIKADAGFEGFALLRQSRLSVMPVEGGYRRRIERLAGDAA